MNLFSVFLNEPLSRLDLSHYCLIPASATVADVMESMRVRDENCALIMAGETLVGIFTDRDVLRRVVDRPDLWQLPIETVMTANPRTLNENVTVAESLSLMEAGHFRNMPVMDERGFLRGNLTYAALLKSLADVFPSDIYNLPPEHDRFAQRRNGA